MTLEPVFIEVTPELFAPAESSSYSGGYELATLSAGPDEYTFDAPLAWKATLTNTGDALLLTGSVSATAQTSCARCLDPVTVHIDGEIEGFFLLTDEALPPEDREDDEFSHIPADHRIDIAPYIQAAVLLELPLIPLCDEDCAGLCSKCGSNLNEGPCGCETDEPDENDAAHPFAVLKGLTIGE